MLKIENVVTPSPEQWEAVVRGVRNPMNSWRLSDSYEAYDCGACGEIEREGSCEPQKHNCEKFRCFSIGPADGKLMAKLRDAGSDHAKYRRMIPVIFDVIAPLYWWKEFDTYKVGTVANSCSTMHKIHEKEFTMEDFSCEHLGYFDPERNDDDQPYLGTAVKIDGGDRWYWYPADVLADIIVVLNHNRKMYIETKDKRYWWQMIQLLPSSYNQRRTVMLNYEVLANIYHARRNHKLDEWHTFCEWIETLPESWIITGKDNEESSMIFETDKPENNDGK